jgi:hypothetical protein
MTRPDQNINSFDPPVAISAGDRSAIVGLVVKAMRDVGIPQREIEGFSIASASIVA